MLKSVTAGAICPGGILLEKGRAMGNTVAVEVANMLAAAWLMLSSLFYSLQLSSGSFPRPLTEEEERYYLDLAGKGDLEARNVLIERNLRLVAHIMKKYYAQTADQEDLISIGTIGLIKGITTFDASKGARLATYAARCVENATLSPRTLRSKTGAQSQNDARNGIRCRKFLKICMYTVILRNRVSSMCCFIFITLDHICRTRFWKPQ